MLLRNFAGLVLVIMDCKIVHASGIIVGNTSVGNVSVYEDGGVWK